MQGPGTPAMSVGAPMRRIKGGEIWGDMGRCRGGAACDVGGRADAAHQGARRDRVLTRPLEGLGVGVGLGVGLEVGLGVRVRVRLRVGAR